MVFCLPNGLAAHRLGIIASKKIGNACVRNKAKRKIREAFRRIKQNLSTPGDIVVIAGRDSAPLPFSILEKKLTQTLQTQL